jgi:hypothetical protein
MCVSLPRLEIHDGRRKAEEPASKDPFACQMNA